MKRGRPSKWTQEQRNQIREMAKMKNCSQLAEEFGVSWGSMKSVLRSMKLRTPRGYFRWPAERCEGLKELAKTCTPKELSIKYGISPQGVSNVLARLGVKAVPGTHLWNRHDTEKLLDLAAAGKSRKEIINLVGFSRWTVEKMIRRLGIPVRHGLRGYKRPLKPKVTTKTVTEESRIERMLWLAKRCA